DLDPDEDAYVTGSFAGQMIIFAYHYASTGSLVWSKEFGYAQSDQGDAIAVDGDGNVFLTGTFTDATLAMGIYQLHYTTGIVGSSFVAKLDNSGNVAWARTVGTSSPTGADAYGTAIALD